MLAETVDVTLPSEFEEPAPLAFQFQETKLSPLDEFQPLSPVVKVKPSESKEVIIPCVPAAEV